MLNRCGHWGVNTCVRTCSLSWVELSWLFALWWINFSLFLSGLKALCLRVVCPSVCAWVRQTGSSLTSSLTTCWLSVCVCVCAAMKCFLCTNFVKSYPGVVHILETSSNPALWLWALHAVCYLRTISKNGIITTILIFVITNFIITPLLLLLLCLQCFDAVGWAAGRAFGL